MASAAGTWRDFVLGSTFGAFWWYLGPLTLLPLMTGGSPTWDVVSAQEALPLLLGHVFYGAATGLALVFIRHRPKVQALMTMVRPGALLRGALAGLICGSLLGVSLSVQDQLQSSVGLSADQSLAPWMLTLLIGLLSGVCFALLYPAPTDGAGPALIRGSVYGFLWWVIAPLTLVPLIGGSGLLWELAYFIQTTDSSTRLCSFKLLTTRKP